MPANKGAESKQGLIITLVGFVLLSIILGVTTYYGYAEQDALKKAAADAKNEAAAAKKNRDWYKYVALQLKQYAGEITKQEAEELANAPGKSTPGEDQGPYTVLFNDLQTRLSKDGALEPYRQKVARLEEELRNTRASLAAEQNNLKKEREDHARAIRVKDDEIEEARKNLEKANADNLADRQKFEQDLASRLKEFSTLDEELEKVRKKAATDVGTREKENQRLKDEAKEQQEARKKLQDQMTPPDLQKFSEPKGKIVDLSGQLAWINLGSRQNIRPQQGLTFSIFGSGTAGRGSMVRKGSLEVVDVLRPDLSQAKITEVVDARNNPIQRGDLLVNPAWSPNMQTHVAIAGLIDFTGEGRDRIDELKRALERQNIVVDAYLDLKDATIKGEMTLKTDYLIIGEPPDLNATAVFREGDTRFERKVDISNKMAAMQTKAQELGISVVPLRRFVALTGYQVPRGARATSGFSYEGRIPPPSANGEGRGAGKKEKKEENNKEESK